MSGYLFVYISSPLVVGAADRRFTRTPRVAIAETFGFAMAYGETIGFAKAYGGSARREGSEGDGSGIVTDLAPKWRQLRRGCPPKGRGVEGSGAFCAPIGGRYLRSAVVP